MTVVNRVAAAHRVAAANRVANGFSPNQLPGCCLWLRADQGLTLNNTNVSQWNDLSGQGQNFTQATTSDQPLWTPTGFNGLPGVTFNGTVTTLENSSFVYGTVSPPQITVLCVFSVTQPVSAQQRLLTQAINTGWTLDLLPTYVQFLVGQSTFTTYTVDEFVNGQSLLGTPSQINCVYNAALTASPRVSCRCNRIAVTTQAGAPVGSPSASSFSNSEPLWLGSNEAVGLYFQGTVAELVICNQQLTAQQISSFESYAQKLWGLP
jgi:hypothetical protein